MSKIEVNAIEPQSGTTLTLGASGDTVTLAAGASQSGFGRSGSVNWDTTPKTANFTAVSGNGYFINTTSGAITINLPSTPAAGDIVAIADYDGTAETNAITVGRNSSNINGDAADLLITKNYSAISFVYVDATAGWRSVDTSNTTNVQNPFVAATGGTITTCGNYKIHTFTGPGTFTVTNIGPGSSTVDYLVIAGGGAGGGTSNPGGGSGGGGAGGFRESVPSPAAWTASPLASPGGSLPVSVQGYPITVGAGGTQKGPGAFVNGAGSNSIFSTITSAGGGDGGMWNSPGPSAATARSPATIASNGTPSTATYVGGKGGSGGGGTYCNQLGGKGNESPVAPSQGNNGGTGSAAPQYSGGGGGGAGAVGSNATTGAGGNGGAGATTSISGSPTAYAGGGGGASSSSTDGTGGTGGGGSGTSPGGTGGTGTANTGGGGGAGGSGTDATGGAGGSGIVVIRYKFQ
jgi:hypothetical protein